MWDDIYGGEWGGLCDGRRWLKSIYICRVRARMVEDDGEALANPERRVLSRGESPFEDHAVADADPRRDGDAQDVPSGRRTAVKSQRAA
jgi:hypothetical protein